MGGARQGWQNIPLDRRVGKGGEVHTAAHDSGKTGLMVGSRELRVRQVGRAAPMAGESGRVLRKRLPAFSIRMSTSKSDMPGKSDAESLPRARAGPGLE